VKVTNASELDYCSFPPNVLVQISRNQFFLMPGTDRGLTISSVYWRFEKPKNSTVARWLSPSSWFTPAPEDLVCYASRMIRSGFNVIVPETLTSKTEKSLRWAIKLPKAVRAAQIVAAVFPPYTDDASTCAALQELNRTIIEADNTGRTDIVLSKTTLLSVPSLLERTAHSLIEGAETSNEALLLLADRVREAVAHQEDPEA
jgi:hypothetical protein